ncbi:MAG: hypothetical protein A2Z04_06080 [Chloroflexi bacterium RBG_16_57_9]|nr:MAG: hypothetical protein A2Z04_06080 [Chloroflexi bacterium RBG_16_57_9]
MDRPYRLAQQPDPVIEVRRPLRRAQARDGHHPAVGEVDQGIAGESDAVVPVLLPQPLKELGMDKAPVGHQDHRQARREIAIRLMEDRDIVGKTHRGPGMTQDAPRQGDGSPAVDEADPN